MGNLFIYHYLSIYLSICLSICLNYYIHNIKDMYIYNYIFLSIYLSIYLHVKGSGSSHPNKMTEHTAAFGSKSVTQQALMDGSIQECWVCFLLIVLSHWSIPLVCICTCPESYDPSTYKLDLSVLGLCTVTVDKQ